MTSLRADVNNRTLRLMEFNYFAQNKKKSERQLNSTTKVKLNPFGKAAHDVLNSPTLQRDTCIEVWAEDNRIQLPAVPGSLPYTEKEGCGHIPVWGT